MIERFACLPRKITRRRFGAAVGTALGAEYVSKRLAYAAGNPFTIAMVPDPQYLAATDTCHSYNALIQWAITNRNLSVSGTALNIKGFVQVGDCCDGSVVGSYSAQQVVAVTAYAQAEAADPKMFVARCAGNHDFQFFSTLVRSNLGYMWREDKNGAWSPTNVAATYSGGMDLGGGDVAYFGGAYSDPTFPVSTANSYMRVSISGRNILIISLSFFPSDAELTWAKSIHDTYLNHECWILTHAYLRHFGTRFAAGDTFSTLAYSMGSRPDCNTGVEMWTSWFSTWSNVTCILSGHDIGGYGDNWVWQRLATTSSSGRAQTVQQIFCDCQDNDQPQTYCSGASPDGTSDTAHLFLMRITPSTNKLEAFLVSTNNAKWTGGQGSLNNASPVQLFNVDFPALTALPTTMMSGAVGLRGTVIVQ